MQSNLKSALFAGAGALVLGIAQAASEPVVLREHDALALSPAGDRVAAVEAVDPGNLPEEAHGVVVVRARDGKLIAQYDPCKTCKYSDTAWSPNGNLLAFIATDSAAGKTTLYVIDKDTPRAAANVDGIANTVRWAPDGARMALLVTQGAHKKAGAVEAGAALVGEIGASEDEQRIAIVAASGGELKLVSPADTYIYEFDWAPTARFRRNRRKGKRRQQLVVATPDTSTRQRCPARDRGAEDAMTLPRVSRDGKTVAFIGGLMSDWGRSAATSTACRSGGTPTNLAPISRARSAALPGAGRSGQRAVVHVGADRRPLRDRHDRSCYARNEEAWSAAVDMKAQEFDGAIAFSVDGSVAAAITEDFNHAEEIASAAAEARAGDA